MIKSFTTTNSKNIKIIIFILLMLGLLLPTIIGFDHLLDDTFIHLRYARNFIYTGKIFYNQDQPSFGTSSLFYLFYISSIVRSFNEQQWPLVIKLSSLLAQVISMFIALNIYFGGKNHKLILKQFILFFLFLLFLFCVPSTTRWLQDGMETSLGLLLSFLSIYALTKFGELRNKWYYNLLMAFIIALPGLLRLDLIPVVFSSLIILFMLEDNKFTTRLVSVSGIAILALVIWLFINYLLLNAITPDSAIAKRSGKFDLYWIVSFVKSMLSTSPIWLGTFLITFLLIFSDEILIKFRLILIVGLIPIVAQILAGLVLGQFIHGARYFFPSLGFQIALIFYVINQHNYFLTFPKIDKTYSYFILFLIVITSVHTIVLWKPITKVIEKSYLSLPNFLNKPGIKIGAADIGQIGWYTNAKILDFSGLVNGRNIAASLPPMRIKKIISKMGFPDYLILKQEDLEEYKKSTNELFLSYKNDTIIYHNTHYLIIKMYNLNRSLDWVLWESKKEKH